MHMNITANVELIFVPLVTTTAAQLYGSKSTLRKRVAYFRQLTYRLNYVNELV